MITYKNNQTSGVNDVDYQICVLTKTIRLYNVRFILTCMFLHYQDKNKINLNENNGRCLKISNSRRYMRKKINKKTRPRHVR